jgi:DNA-binding PadR family transcriptional regulator
MDSRRGADPSLLVLISLAAGPKHGHAILLDIERFMGRRLGPGTLYGAIERLERDGLIESLPAQDRRTPYRLTSDGARYVADRVSQMKRLTEIAQARVQS